MEWDVSMDTIKFQYTVVVFQTKCLFEPSIISSTIQYNII